jgi:hypothetical protein
MGKGLIVASKQIVFISACLLLTLFPFPAILVKVLINTVKYLITGELNASY